MRLSTLAAVPIRLTLSLLLFALAQPASAESFCWTAAGSAAGIAGNSQDFYGTPGWGLQVKPNAPVPSTVIANYFVSGIFEDDGTFLSGKRMFIRYKDSGPSEQVIVELQQVSLAGGSTTLLTFDSNAYPQSSSLQGVFLATPCALDGAFSFIDNLYHVRVSLIKSAEGGAPALYILQLCGGACV